jgi:exopolyphosphatase/guanosine-5'-triphosphate,3'-diphosphate pyrophosphatase
MNLNMKVYDGSRVNGLVLREDWLSETVSLLSSLPVAQRCQLTGLEPGREVIILGGALMVRELLSMLGFSQFTAIDSGLLEGLLITMVEKQQGRDGNLISTLRWQTPARPGCLQACMNPDVAATGPAPSGL